SAGPVPDRDEHRFSHRCPRTHWTRGRERVHRDFGPGGAALAGMLCAGHRGRRGYAAPRNVQDGGGATMRAASLLAGLLILLQPFAAGAVVPAPLAHGGEAK